MSAPNPYVDLPPSAFWRRAVSDVSPLEIADLYQPCFPITRQTVIATAGSCFAQHIGNRLKAAEFNFLDVEPPPPMLPEALWRDFSYGMYSGRYGNVYSIRQLLQMFQRAYGLFTPSETVWEIEGRFYDPFRPTVEPGGFASAEEAGTMGGFHLSSLRRILKKAEVFVFTFGLTEGWIDAKDGAVYPTCPGTIIGTFDSSRHRFHNFTFAEVMADAEAFIAFAREHNPDIKFLFTVSPVPLTATASGEHVLTASLYSKSVLRAVCGELYQKHDGVDYFPSYEMVASHPYRAMFFNPNLRSVSHRGVDHVMAAFLSAHGGADRPEEVAQPEAPTTAEDKALEEERAACEEEALEDFGR